MVKKRTCVVDARAVLAHLVGHFADLKSQAVELTHRLSDGELHGVLHRWALIVLVAGDHCGCGRPRRIHERYGRARLGFQRLQRRHRRW